ncbi:MAG TPA: VOC family protein [Kineosporiaceae bacterium]|nr:VOC family protein [Kineosporiaceae bacterium]
MAAVESEQDAVTAQTGKNFAEHKDLHSDQGALPGEHPGRSANPTIKVSGLAWLEFEKVDLNRSERFAIDFGLTVHARTDDALYLRAARDGAPCVVIRQGSSSRFIGPVFHATEGQDLDRLARATGGTVEARHELGSGRVVRVSDPSGFPVTVVHGVEELPALPTQTPLTWNVGGRSRRVNATQRPPREPARVERLGHIVLGTRVFGRALDWYLEHLGLIVSDFLYLEGQRERGPVMAFIRCDRGSEPSDHHTLAMLLAPETGYVHSAYEVADLDALAAGGEYLRDRGYRHSWGIGRHIQGSQVFDYWRDPDRVMVEHYADGDVFDASLEPGWTPLSASGLRQWGPKPTRDFLGTTPSPALVRQALEALREDNEIDLARLTGLIKAMNR